MMGFIWFVIMGGLIGWVASMIMNRDAAMGKFWNVVVGIVGSFIGNTLFSFILGTGDIGSWPPDLMGIASALLGAVVLLGVLNLIQRGNVRGE
ncbi:MAG: GlsB/YeaQ/YmgE family stress response membrane protein [Erythrobacter sp.]|uniref:GlsB/YeaQ/YmgE family stress response membrane protein n=1 Tax=Erythrobacter sp. TaxID=1042 RepID=UPI00329A6B2F